MMLPAVMTGALLGGCGGPAIAPDLRSPAPNDKLAAITEIARRGEKSAIPQLIAQLDAADPAVRLAAIEALEDLTGERKGYRFDDPPAERREAIRRWVDAFRRDGEPRAATRPDVQSSR